VSAESHQPQPADAANTDDNRDRLAFETAARTHVGSVRTLNEDRFLAMDEFGLWAVADGMGGHLNGDVAAETLIEELAWPDHINANTVRAAIERANRRLINSAGGSLERASGSTIVALLLDDRCYECLWVGDSEVWRMRDGKLTKLTRDHSVVEDLIQAGVLTDAERRSHPQAHIITRAIGVDDQSPPDFISGEYEPGDLFLVCSDGLTNAVPREEMQAILAGEDLHMAADSLLERSLANGASDNVTFVLVRRCLP
jgi:serine/threonine protein phosphatase PrpC